MNMTIDCKVLCSPDFNTRYIKENASWVPPSGRESISIAVQQSEGGPPASAQLPISVRAVDRAPQVTVMMPDRAADRRQSASASDGEVQLALAQKTHDIYFCGGTVPCVCPEAALACVQLDDGDSCDAKARSEVGCDSREAPQANGRLSIKSTYSNIWFFDGSQIGTWADGSTCASTHRELGPRVLKEMGDLRPGAALHAIDLMLPLPLMQSGLLRIWPSRAHYGADSLSVAFQGPQLTADGVVVKSLPLVMAMNNTYCATLDPPICLGLTNSADDDELAAAMRGQFASIFMFGLIGAAGCWILLSKDIFYGLLQRLSRAFQAGAPKGPEEHDPFAEEREGRWMVHYDVQRDSAERLMLRQKMSEVQQRAREMAAGLAKEEDAAARQELMELYEVERLLKEKIDALASNRYWYHTKTRETTWHDPAARARGNDKPGQENQQASDLGLRATQHPEGVEVSVTPSLKSASTYEVGSDLVFAEPARPPTKDPFAKPDNSMITASLLGNSNWARGHGEAGKDAAQAGQASVAQVAASLGE